MYSGGNDVAATLRLNVKTSGNDTVRNLAGDVAKATAAFAGIGVAAGAFAVKSAAGYQDVIQHVKAFAATSASARAEVDKMSQQILTQMPAMGLSATKAAEGLYQFESAGIRGKDAMIALKQSALAAAASNTDLATTANVLTTAINAYGLKGKEIKAAQDDLTQAAAIGRAEFSDLAATMGQILPMAANVHIGLKELGAEVAVLTNAGNSASESMVLLRNSLTVFSNITKQQAGAMKDLGLSMDDVSLRSHGLVGVFQNIHDALEQQKITGQEADQALAHLFRGNTEAARAYFALFNDGGQKVHAALKSMQDDAGATSKAYQEASKTASHAWDVLTATIQAQAIMLGSKLLPPITAAVSGIATAITAHSSDIQQAFNNIGGMLKDPFDNAKTYVSQFFNSLSSGENRGKFDQAKKDLVSGWNQIWAAIRGDGETHHGGADANTVVQFAADAAKAFKDLGRSIHDFNQQFQGVADALNATSRASNEAGQATRVALDKFSDLMSTTFTNIRKFIDLLGQIKDITGQGLFGNSGIEGFKSAILDVNTPLGTLVNLLGQIKEFVFPNISLPDWLKPFVPGQGSSAPSPQSYTSRGVVVPHNLGTRFPGATAPSPLTGSLFGIPGVGTLEEITNPAYPGGSAAARSYAGVANPYTHSDIGAVNQNVYLPGGANARYTLVSAGFDPQGGYYELWKTPNGGYFRFYHLQNTGTFQSLEDRLKHGPVTVQGGVLVATSGDTGSNTSGPHLHVGADKPAYAYIESAGAPRSAPGGRGGPVGGPTPFNPNVGAGTSAAYLPNLPANLRPHWADIVKYANSAGMDPLVFAAQIYTESGTSGLFKVGPTYDAGEYHVGALQVGEAEAREIGDYGLWLKIRRDTARGVYHPEDQLKLGADFDRYLKTHGYPTTPGLLTRYNGSTTYRDTVLSRAAAFGSGANYNAVSAGVQHRPYFGDIGAYLAPRPRRPAGAIGVEGTPIYFGDVDVTGRHAGYNAAAVVAAALEGRGTGPLGALGITGTGVEGRPSRSRTGHEPDAADANAVATAVALGLFPNLRNLKIGTAGIGAAAAAGVGVDAVYRPRAAFLAEQFSAQGQALQDTITKYSAAAAQAILSGAGNLGNFVNHIVRASNEEDQRQRISENVALRVARARGDSATILGIQTGRAQATQTAATADIARMLLTGQLGHYISTAAPDGGVGRQRIYVDDLQHSIDQAAAAAKKQKDIADAEADAASRVAEATGDFSARLQYLSGKVSEVADQSMSALVLGLHEGATNLKDLVTSSAATKVALDAWNAVQTAATAMQTAAIANDSKLMAVELQLADVQDAAAEVAAGFSLKLASLRGDLAGMGQAIQELSDLAIRRWSQAVMEGAGVFNSFTPAVQAAAKAADAVADAQAASQIVLGRLTGNLGMLSSGLNAVLTKATDGIGLFTAEIGRAKDGLPVITDGIGALASKALKAASNLGSFSDTLSAIGNIVSQLQGTAETEFARTGGISGATISAYQGATQQQQAAFWTQVGGDLRLAHGTHDLNLEMDTLGKEIELQKKRVSDAAAVYGTSSAEYQKQVTILRSLQKELQGLQDWVKINIDGEKLAADATKEQTDAWNEMAAGAADAWNQFINEGLDPASIAAQDAAQRFGISATDIEDAFTKAKDGATSLSGQALSAADALGRLVTAINAAIAKLQGLGPPVAPQNTNLPGQDGNNLLGNRTAPPSPTDAPGYNPPTGAKPLDQAAYTDGYTVGSQGGERTVPGNFKLNATYWYQGFDAGMRAFNANPPRPKTPAPIETAPPPVAPPPVAPPPTYLYDDASSFTQAYYSGKMDASNKRMPMSRPTNWSESRYNNYLRGYQDGLNTPVPAGSTEAAPQGVYAEYTGQWGSEGALSVGGDTVADANGVIGGVQYTAASASGLPPANYMYNASLYGGYSIGAPTGASNLPTTPDELMMLKYGYMSDGDVRSPWMQAQFAAGTFLPQYPGGGSIRAALGSAANPATVTLAPDDKALLQQELDAANAQIQLLQFQLDEQKRQTAIHMDGYEAVVTVGADAGSYYTRADLAAVSP